MSDDVFQGRRVVRSYRQSIEAPPSVVFPLLCPVREVEWLDGFAFEMIYSASGLIENGCVFKTSSPGEADTTWVVSRHEPASRILQFTRVTPDSRTCVLDIAVQPDGVERSHVDIAYAYTSTSKAGDEFLNAWTEESFVSAMTFWERSMNHFLKTGQQLRRAGAG